MPVVTVSRIRILIAEVPLWPVTDILRGTLNYLVQFSAVEPYAPAIRAIVNFYSAAVSHYQIYITIRAFHDVFGFKFSIKTVIYHYPVDPSAFATALMVFNNTMLW
jgi:hypothetical protein